MGLQQFTEAELQTKAEQLGLVEPGHPIPTAMASKVKAAIVEERRAESRQRTKPAAEPQAAKSIVIQPGGQILVDGEQFPWLVARTAMEIGLAPDADGVSTVRLTLLAHSVQVLKPATDSTESE